jgi:hypothetical protein
MNARRLRLRHVRGSVVGLALFGQMVVLACGSSDGTRKVDQDGGAAGQGGDAGDSVSPGGAGSGGSAVENGGGGASDGGSDAAGAAAGRGDAGSDTSGNTVTFVEDFVSTDNVDLDGSTASVDTADSGRAFGPAPYELGSFGDGSDGAYASSSDVGMAVELAAGEHQFTTFVAHNVEISSPGDVIIRVQGDFVLEEFAFLEAPGRSPCTWVGRSACPTRAACRAWAAP